MSENEVPVYGLRVNKVKPFVVGTISMETPEAARSNPWHPHWVEVLKGERPAPSYIIRSVVRNTTWHGGTLKAECHCEKHFFGRRPNVPEHTPPASAEELRELAVIINGDSVSVVGNSVMGKYTLPPMAVYGCGIHASATFKEPLEWLGSLQLALNPATLLESIIFLAQAEGRTVFHQEGWRAEAARLVGIVDIGYSDDVVFAETMDLAKDLIFNSLCGLYRSDAVRMIEVISGQYGIPVISIEEAVSLTKTTFDHYVRKEGDNGNWKTNPGSCGSGPSTDTTP